MSRNQLTRIEFPKFVPEIEVLDQRSWFWREGFQMLMIFVPIWQLLVNENMLSKASSKGLHDFLRFDGKIVLSMVIPDELIDKLETEISVKVKKGFPLEYSARYVISIAHSMDT
jgi:hypothetical protein